MSTPFDKVALDEFVHAALHGNPRPKGCPICAAEFWVLFSALIERPRVTVLWFDCRTCMVAIRIEHPLGCYPGSTSGVSLHPREAMLQECAEARRQGFFVW